MYYLTKHAEEISTVPIPFFLTTNTPGFDANGEPWVCPISDADVQTINGFVGTADLVYWLTEHVKAYIGPRVDLYDALRVRMQAGGAGFELNPSAADLNLKDDLSELLNDLKV